MSLKFGLIVAVVLVADFVLGRGLTEDERRAVGSEMSEYPVVDVVQLWPQLAPGETNAVPGHYVDEPSREKRVRSAYRNCTSPELMIFLPKGKRSGTCLIVCAGGSYERICCNEIAKGAVEYLKRGCVCAVLLYRVPRPRDSRAYWLPALQDGRRALRYMRKNADIFGVNPQKIGIIGFSAGGNLAVRTALDVTTELAEEKAGLEGVSSVPDFVVAIYPAYLDGPDGTLCEGLMITKDSPPMCIIQGDLDGSWVLGSAALYAALHRAGVPAQFVVYGQCGHGLGESWPTVSEWPRLAADWVHLMGF